MGLDERVSDAGLAGAEVGGHGVARLYPTTPSEVFAILLATERDWKLWAWLFCQVPNY